MCDFQNGLWAGKKPPFILTKVIRNTNFKNNDGTLNFNDVAEIEVESRQLENRLLEKGDLILERSGGGPTQPVGRVVYFNANGRFSFSNFTSRIRVKNAKELNSEYLWRYLNLLYISGVTEKLQKQTTGIRNLVFSEYKNLQIPLPPIAEQRKIVAKLERVLGKIKEAKKLREEAQIATKSLLSAELQKIFEEGKKKKWEEVSLGSITNKFQYGSSKRSSISGDVPCLRMGNLQNGEIEWADLKYAPKDEDIKKFLLRDGDVLFNRTNSPVLVGKTAIFRGERPAVFAGYLIRIEYDKKKISGAFLNYCLNSDFAKEFCRNIKTDGVSQSNINAQKLATFTFPLPPLAEQKKIVARLDALSAKVQTLRQAQSETASALSAFEKSVLCQAFTSKFVKEPTKVSVTRTREQWFGIKQGIVAVLEKLSQTAYERGEMVIAKYMFFLQEIYKIPFGLNFIQHQFGPYDPDIKKAITSSAFNKDKFFILKGAGDKQVYSLGNNSSKLLNYSSKILEKSRYGLSELMQYTAKAKSADIERLASVCKVVQDNQSLDEKIIQLKMAEWKPGKFTTSQIKKSLEFIIEKNWNKSLLKNENQ